MLNEWMNFRFILTEDLNNMMIELLITNQMLEENISKEDRKLLEEHKNKLILSFRDEFRKHNEERLKLYNELINK